MRSSQGADQGADRLDAQAASLSRRRGRWRFASLWVASTARSGADAGLRLFVVLLATAGTPGQRESAWHLVMALFMLPCVLMAPVNGALGNSLPKRAVLAGAAAYMLAATLAFGLHGGAWHAGVAVIALGSALFVPTRFAMLPAAAADTGWPLVRVTAWIEAGAVLAMASGMLLAGALAAVPPLAGLPAMVWVLWALGLVCLLACLPVHFAADLRRPEPPAAALRGFFADLRRIVGNRAAVAALLGLALFRGLVTASVGALLAAVLERESASGPEGTYATLLTVTLLSMAGAGLGSMLAGLLRGREDGGEGGLALVPACATGMALALAWVAQAQAVPLALCLGVGLLGGLVNVPLLVAYQTAVSADARGNAMAILNTAGYIGIVLLAAGMAALSAARVLSATGQLLAMAGLTAAAAAVAWRALLPQVRAVVGAMRGAIRK